MFGVCRSPSMCRLPREIVVPQVVKSAGSTPGRVLFDPRSGQRWYVKSSPSPEHARNELAANRLYALAGVTVPDARLSRDGSRYMSAVVDGVPWVESSPEARRDFVVDAWLANWDAPVAGNILIGGDGTAYRVDVGGALGFRARGERRNLGPEVWELETMRDRDPDISAAGAELYAGVTRAEERDAIRRIVALDEADIRATIADVGAPARLADVLLDRRGFLADRYSVRL